MPCRNFLAVDIWVKKRLIALCETHHCLIYGSIAVRIELHCLTNDICGLGLVARKQTHFVHGIKELSVGGLEAIYLGESS